jgi:hypothetical protein
MNIWQNALGWHLFVCTFSVPYHGQTSRELLMEAYWHTEPEFYTQLLSYSVALSTRWKWMVRFTARSPSLYRPGEVLPCLPCLPCPLNRRLVEPQSRLGICGVQSNLALLRMEPGSSNPQPVAIVTALLLLNTSACSTRCVQVMLYDSVGV